jgi:hypothetical protein
VSVVYLDTCDGTDARALADEMDAGNITHAAMIYRKEDGDVCYHLLGADDLTYLIGMVERAKIHMHCTDRYVMPED